MTLIKLTESQKLWNFNIILVMALGVLFIVKANPTSEMFSCNEDRICKLETTYYFPQLNRTKDIKLNLGCCLEPIESYYTGKSDSWYEYHLGLDNRLGKTNKLFKRSYGSVNSLEYSDDYGYELLKSVIEGFEMYKKEPSAGFVIQSPAEAGDFAFWLYAWVIVMTVLMIWNVLDKNKGNT